MSPTGFSANLAISTYLKDGFTPAAIAADLQGNVYLAGSAVIDPASQATGAAVAKVNPQSAQYLYLSYLDSAASDQVAAIAVDSSGNAYVAGSTTNPNFPVIGGSAFGTAPAGGADARSFVTKLNPQGAVVFSVLIGGSAISTARGIAITPQGRILVSGIAASNGFPSTPGAYSVADSTNQWYLTELDAAASKMIFSATGIGGSSLVLDATGNIYMAGSSVGTNYPTTPGAYQTTFSLGHYCFGFCQTGFPGNLQHVTKTDAAASKLIYSTGLNDPKGAAGSTTNTGLAVDAAGNAYVTGTLFEGQYPFTVTAAQGATSYLTKLDPAGASVLFSVPVGGGGVQLDSSGAIYIGGAVTSVAPIGFPGLGPPPPVAIPPAFSGIPQVCVPNFTTAISAAYVLKVDPATGAVQDAQWIDGSAPGATGITLAGGKVWITGPTPGPQVPISPGALMPPASSPGFLEGVYLSAVDFATPATSGPSIACVLDGGNLSHAGAVAAFQLLSIFGTNLGPAVPVQAPDGADPSIGGVSVTFDGVPAQLLYVSASQINLAVPGPSPSSAGSPAKSSTIMQLTYNGVSVRRQFALTASNLNLFADLSTNRNPCPNGAPSDNGFQPVAANADGSMNSCTNPAQAGSIVSFFAHGAGGFGSAPPRLVNLHASVGFGCTALVTNTSLVTDFVYKLDVSLPASFEPCGESFTGIQGIPVTVSYRDAPVGPLYIPADLAGPVTAFLPPGEPMRMIVWVKQ
ncbi:MAG TPA: SBBP repeat-containing protein [Bryobacteraceae bacterium]|nr:SBBP repeat-containing protein [Bryobacteraceae bacterium]